MNKSVGENEVLSGERVIWCGESLRLVVPDLKAVYCLLMDPRMSLPSSLCRAMCCSSSSAPLLALTTSWWLRAAHTAVLAQSH